MMDENADEWSDVGSYIVDSEYNREELISQVEALQDRAIDLERMRDLNKADAVSLATDVVRLMRKVPYVAR
jgi:IS30 family transposase